MGFKDEVKRINKKFYVKEFDGEIKVEKKTSAGLIYWDAEHHIQVWDIDGRGEHYCVMDIKDRKPGRGDIEWLKEADKMRRDNSQVRNMKQHQEKVRNGLEKSKKDQRALTVEMMKDFRPYLLKKMDKVGL